MLLHPSEELEIREASSVTRDEVRYEFRVRVATVPVGVALTVPPQDSWCGLGRYGSNAPNRSYLLCIYDTGTLRICCPRKPRWQMLCPLKRNPH